GSLAAFSTRIAPTAPSAKVESAKCASRCQWPRIPPVVTDGSRSHTHATGCRLKACGDPLNAAPAGTSTHRLFSAVSPWYWVARTTGASSPPCHDAIWPPHEANVVSLKCRALSCACTTAASVAAPDPKPPPATMPTKLQRTNVADRTPLR